MNRTIIDLMAEFLTYSNTIYWTYRIDDIFWNQLEKNFNTKQFKISSFKPNAVRKGDIILIFKNCKIASKTGFIAVCQVETDMAHNEKGVKIFSDKNMNKFFCELSAVFILDNVIHLSSFKNHIEDFDSASFRRVNIGENTMFIKLSETVANTLVPIITEYVPLSQQENNDDIEEENDDEQNVEPEVDLYENEDDNLDDIEVKLGHFPICFEPCGKFKWSDDMNVRIKNFKHHYEKCDECNRTDNNEIPVTTKFAKAEFHFTDLKNASQVDKLIDYYQNAKRWRLEFADSEKKYEHVIINRINVPDGHFYNGCCFVLW